LHRKPFICVHSPLIAICDMWWTQTQRNTYYNPFPYSICPSAQVPTIALPSTIAISDMRWEPIPNHILSMVYFRIVSGTYHIPLRWAFPRVNSNCDMWWTWTWYHLSTQIHIFSSPPFCVLQSFSLLNYFYVLNKEAT